MSELEFSARNLAVFYKRSLLEDVIPFWETHSRDEAQGGYFTCLNRDGSVFDTDKFMWLQARQVWTFSMLYNRLEKRADWLDMARHGATFLRRHGMDADGNWYFSLDRAGRPLVQPCNIFSDCFAAMAFAQYALASGEAEAADLARRTFDGILRRESNPKGVYNKQVAGTRPMKSFALPMILSNLTLELEQVLPAAQVESRLDAAVREVMEVFRDPATGLVLENVGVDGSTVDSFEGRLLCPGHTIEAMWFMMDIGRRRGDSDLIGRAVEIMLATIEKGWDQEHGGIFYFLDRAGRPPQQLEWDQKLWWVHLETLVALSLGYALTRRPDCLEAYKKVHAYAWPRFADPEYGEWFGYLNRRGEVLLPLKGGKWKGCFHVPRALYLCGKIWSDLAHAEAAK